MVDQADTSHVPLFDAAAKTYDAFSNVQAQFFDMLLPHLPDKATAIMDIGCGTGASTLKLTKKYPQVPLLGIDTSENMITYAKTYHAHPNVTYMKKDMRIFRPKNTFDLWVSNCCLQWLSPTDIQSSPMFQHRSSGTYFVTCILGPNTFWELQQIIQNKRHIPAQKFATQNQWKSLFGQYFTTVNAQIITLQCLFPSLYDWLKTIRYSGTKTADSTKSWGLGELRTLENTLISEFGQVRMTYEGFLFQCQR